MYEFRLPDLGEGIHEGEVLKWFVRPGDVIAEDAPLVEVETDKAAVTIPSPRGGRVVQVRAREGETVHVGEVLVVLDTGEGVAAGTEAGGTTVEAAGAPGQAATTTPGALGGAPRAGEAAKAASVPEAATGLGSAGAVLAARVAAAPATRRLAREMGIDIRRVPGTGPGGRVTADDVRRFAAGGAGTATGSPGVGKGEAGPQAPTGAAAPLDTADQDRPKAVFSGAGIPYLDLEPLPDFSRFGEVVREPVRSIRRKVARNTVTSMILIPHVAHMDEADVTDLEAFRRQENARRGPGETRLTLLAFLVRAVTIALKRHPVFNATLDPFREELVFKRYYHIGIAVDTERGLIVPNLKHADRQSVGEVARGITDLAQRAREGRILVEDLQGGTFTITNIGVLGGTSFVPAIHYPESAILGTGRAAEKPMVRNGQVVVRTMLPMTLSFDHRVADGAEAARFVGLVRDLLENPLRLAVEG